MGDDGGGEQHPFATDPTAMAVLSAFRQVLHNTQGIIVDSGEGLRVCWRVLYAPVGALCEWTRHGMEPDLVLCWCGGLACGFP